MVPPMDEKEEIDQPSAKKLKPLVLVTQLAVTMITPIIMCLFIGIWLDKKFTSSNVYTLIGILMGVLTSYRNAYMMLKEYTKSVRKNVKRNDNKEKRDPNKK